MSEMRSVTDVILQFRNSSGSNDSAGFGAGGGGSDIDNDIGVFVGGEVTCGSGGRRKLSLTEVVDVACGGYKV